MDITVTCCKCGVEFKLPDAFVQDRRDDGESLFCPNGHELSYRQSKNLGSRYSTSRKKIPITNHKLPDTKASG